MKTILTSLLLLFSLLLPNAYAEQGNFKQCQDLCGVSAGCNQCCAEKYNECRNSCYETRQGCIKSCLETSSQDPEKTCEKACASDEKTCGENCNGQEFEISACTSANA